MMTRQQAEVQLKLLEEHFGEPVQPVSRYCGSLETWASAVRQNPDMARLSQSIGEVFLAIRKSNLLARLIYGGQKLRTRKCPVHKGHWSGCVFEDPGCGCLDGSNVTGWLAEAEPPMEEV
jgi:hypothetical protein